MMRKRLTPGVVLGIGAVVIACTGSATATSLITGAKIKDGTITSKDIKKGTISSDRLASSVRAQLLKAGTPGPAGPTGATGAPGSTVQGSAPQAGPKGDNGADGKNGKDGANPATLVASSGDAGWTAVGGGSYPSATFSGGKLRLQGGFDGSTPSGAIGLAHGYDNVALSSLKTLSYDFRVVKRPSGNVTAPTIHISVLKAATGTSSGFTNFVFEPYVQDDFTVGLNQNYSMDAMAGKWWATRKTGDIEQAKPSTWAHLIATNPDATISAISIDNGGSSGPGTIPGDQFAADADNMIVGFGSSFTRYDFGG